MKRLITITLTILFISFFQLNATAQEKHGSTLNLGVGIGGYGGYYKYTNRSLPVININYEFDVAKSFTLAPFVSFSTYTNSLYRDKNKSYYVYRETIIPIGVKGTYYLDDVFKANSKWDFYLAGSLGFALINSHWDQGYDGDRDYYRTGNPLFLDLHLGAEYHFNNRVGAFLDLSTGVSTIGLAIH